MRKNWGVPHRVTEELAAQFWQQRGVRVHTGGWVCTDAFETVRTPLARAPTEVLPVSAGGPTPAGPPRSPTSCALYASHSGPRSAAASTGSSSSSNSLSSSSSSSSSGSLAGTRTPGSLTGLGPVLGPVPPVRPGVGTEGAGRPGGVSAARLNELYRAAREECGTPPLCEAPAETAVLLGYFEKQVTPRLDMLTGAYLKLEGRLEGLAAEIARTTAEQKKVLQRLGELAARVGAPPTPVRHPLTHPDTSTSTSASNTSNNSAAVTGGSGTEAGAGTQTGVTPLSDEAVHQLDLLLSSARGGECRLESLAERLQTLRDTLTGGIGSGSSATSHGSSSATEPKTP